MNERNELEKINESNASQQDINNEATVISWKFKLETIDKWLNRAEKFGRTEKVKLLSKKESQIMIKTKDVTEESSKSSEKAYITIFFDLIDSSKNEKEDKHRSSTKWF